MDAIQVTTGCFMQRKSKRIHVENTKSRGKDWKMSGLEVNEKQVLSPKHQFGLSKENTVNYCPIAVKWLYLQCNFFKFSRGACPWTHLKAPTFSSHFVHVRKNPTLQRISLEVLENEPNILSVELTLIDVRWFGKLNIFRSH